VYRDLRQANLPAQIIVGYGNVPTPNVPDLPVIAAGQVVVMIDPGHGGADPGAVGIGGLQEKVINLAVARRVQQLLQQQGVAAPLTRTGDQEVDLDPRVVLADRADADLFVSIHSNAISLSRPEVNGVETYYYDSGYGLATAIHNSILSKINMRDRGVRQAGFYVLRYASMPSVLVETGFVTGREDAARLSNPAFRDEMAEAIAAGILNYIQRTALGQ
jgi:N-acetylmuramoyl-L-alanine amidase